MNLLSKARHITDPVVVPRATLAGNFRMIYYSRPPQIHISARPHHPRYLQMFII